jgi:putative addiction module killer protein
MYFIEKTPEFDKWLTKLIDLRAIRLQKLEKDEHFGECKFIGNGIRELKIDFAKGYRIYFAEAGGAVIILLAGGDKSSQEKDIIKANEIFKRLKK